MTDRVQHGGLNRIAAPQCLRIRGRDCELAHDNRGHEEDRERDPVLRLPQGERVQGRQEEEVEGEHAHERDADGIGEAVEDRHRQHREEVERPEAEDRRDLVQPVDRAAHDRHSREAHRYPRGIGPHVLRIRSLAELEEQLFDVGRPRADLDEAALLEHTDRADVARRDPGVQRSHLQLLSQLG